MCRKLSCMLSYVDEVKETYGHIGTDIVEFHDLRIRLLCPYFL